MRRLFVSSLIIVSLVALTGCDVSPIGVTRTESVAPPMPTAAPTQLDPVGMRLDEAISAVEDFGLIAVSHDVREERSIWDETNWVVVSALLAGNTMTLGVEKIDDPPCWSRSTVCEWVEAFRFSAAGDGESEVFELDGPARLHYSVSVGTLADGKRAADILFQDIRRHTESSSIDTTIHVDEPGDGVFDLGERSGSYFLMTQVREFDVADPQIDVVVEEMRRSPGAR